MPVGESFFYVMVCSSRSGGSHRAVIIGFACVCSREVSCFAFFFSFSTYCVTTSAAVECSAAQHPGHALSSRRRPPNQRKPRGRSRVSAAAAK